MASWPPLLRADTCAAMLNFEIADHPVYEGLELQWFDDAAHGTGMLAFLGRRDSHVFDYYAQRGLRLDAADYQVGAGTGAWVETDIADVQPPGPAPDGVAEAAVDGGTVRLVFDPPLPDLTALPDRARRDGSWSVSADGDA